jgi:hypothetical protein
MSTRRAGRQSRRGRPAAPEGRTWLQRVELPEFAAHALRVLHSAHEAPGTVLGDAQIAEFLLGPTRELLQRNFRRTGGVSAPMRALRLEDGFVFDVSGRPAAEGAFEGDLFFTTHHSRNLDKDFGTLLVASRGVPLSTAAALPRVAEVLEKLYPSWRAITEAPRSRDAEFPATVQTVRRDCERTREDTFRVSAAAFEQLRRRVGDADGVTRVEAEGLGVRLLHRDGLLVLGLRHPECEQEVTFEVRPGAFGTTIEHGVAGLYVHGGRALLRALLTANPVAPVAAATTPPHDDLTTCDNLVLAVRAMGLSTTYPETELFALLGIKSEDPSGPVPPPPEGVSAYPLPSEARLAGICSDVLVRTLARYGVPRGETCAATLGAWAVLARRAGGGFRERGAVCLNAEPELEGAQGALTRAWREATLARHAAVRVAAGCLDWFGRDVSVTHVALDGAHTLLFADEDGPFALAGRPYEAVRGAPPPPHTALCQRLAAGRAPEPEHPVPAAEALAALSRDAPGAAARRLAVIDTLSASFPQFAPAARALRCVWLHSEKRRLAAAGVAGADYCRRMCELSQLSHLPEGPHFWASVPFLPG